MSIPAILVVIPCLNEERHIERLVHNLAQPAHTDFALGIVIADGGSTDRTPQIAKKLAVMYPNVWYLHNTKRIQSAAVNLAVATFYNEAQFLIRLDAHADYPLDYCRTLFEEAMLTGATSVVVAMNTQGVDCFQQAVAAASNSRLGNGGSAHRRPGKEGRWVDHGHHALIRMDAFKSVGGYDESFTHNEDAELDTRLRKAGFSIWLTHKTSLVYHPRSTPLGLFQQYANYGRGRARTLLKHRGRPRLRQMLPVAVAPVGVLALGAPLWWFAAMPLLLWMALCLSYGMILGMKTRHRCVMASGLAAMIMHLAWSIGFWQALLRHAARRRV